MDATPGPASRKRKPNLIALLGPGLLIAATGVGAGDLATASLTGSLLGTAVLWAVLLGAFLKFVLNEGLARWQLVTGETFLEGTASRLGRVVGWLFLPYLLIWSFFVATALMSACGVTLHAMIPVFDDASRGKVIFGVAASLAGLALVWWGGYRIFERFMGVCIAVMFVTVLVTAAALWPGTTAVLKGLFVPTLPDTPNGESGVAWTVALLGGVGGTLTVLCYGYWIREEGRTGPTQLRLCRIDLGMGYVLTAFFGVAMVIIGSTVNVDGKGATLIVQLANQLEGPLGVAGRWAFLIGAFGAVFSSLLGVWQAVPYLFADVWRIFFSRPDGVPAAPAELSQRLRGSPAYRGYMIGLAVVPMLGLVMSFKEVQKVYAVIGATFIPLLAVGLLALNTSRRYLGEHANRWWTVAVLLAALGLFILLGYEELFES